MPSIPLTIQDPGTFAYTEGQTFYNEKLAFELLKHAASMSSEGYEISWEDADLTDAWTAQDEILNQQSALLDALEENDAISADWRTRISSAKSQITTLLSLATSTINFDARKLALTVIETFFNSIAVSAAGTPEAEEDLIEVLKAAFLEETVPGSGVYLSTTMEQLTTIVQAVQDLKYNDEILEIPATPRPIRIHLQGKTIQQ